MHIMLNVNPAATLWLTSWSGNESKPTWPPSWRFRSLRLLVPTLLGPFSFPPWFVSLDGAYIFITNDILKVNTLSFHFASYVRQKNSSILMKVITIKPYWSQTVLLKTMAKIELLICSSYVIKCIRLWRKECNNIKLLTRYKITIEINYHYIPRIAPQWFTSKCFNSWYRYIIMTKKCFKLNYEL